MLYIPDTMPHWPWPRAINPHYEEIKAESTNWFRRFKAFSARSQYAFDRCDFTLLAALVYPHAQRDQFRIGSDLMFFLFLIDEYTDVESGPNVQKIVDIIIDALENPEKLRPKDENILGEVARQFWVNASKIASSSSQHHFLRDVTSYLNSVVQQAEDRDNEIIYSVESYFETRRGNVGVRPCFFPFELMLELPDEVVYHPVILELASCVVDLVTLDNDIVSYNKEQAIGDNFQNVLNVVMHNMETDLEGAIQWAVDYHDRIQQDFLEGLRRVPSWGDKIDNQVKQYLFGLANWPRGNSCWSFEGGRYFGKKGLDYQRTRLVPLLPKLSPTNKGLPRCCENAEVYLVEG